MSDSQIRHTTIGSIQAIRLTRGRSYFARDNNSPVQNESAQPATVDSKTMAFEAIVCTERYIKVMLPGSREVVEEVLIAGGGDFPQQIPLCDNHMRMSVQNILGAVDSFRRDQQSLWIGTGKFTPGVKDAEEAWARVSAGHLTDVSIGYRVYKHVSVAPGRSKRVDGRMWRAGDLWLRVATEWRVHELSLTAIGADEVAKIKTTSGKQAAPVVSHFAR